METKTYANFDIDIPVGNIDIPFGNLDIPFGNLDFPFGNLPPVPVPRLFSASLVPRTRRASGSHAWRNRQGGGAGRGRAGQDGAGTGGGGGLTGACNPHVVPRCAICSLFGAAATARSVSRSRWRPPRRCSATMPRSTRRTTPPPSSWSWCSAYVTQPAL